MNNTKIPLKNIALEIGVSPATISLVLHGKKGVSDENRAKILEILQERGYVQRSSLTASKNVYLVKYVARYFKERNNEFINSLIDSIEQEARLNNINITIRICEDGEFMKVMDIVKDSAPDGLIILGSELPLIYNNYFMTCHFPIVMVDSCMPSCEVDSVVIDNDHFLSQILKFIKSSSFSGIGYIGGIYPKYNTIQRKNSFFRIFSESTISFQKDMILTIEPSSSRAYHDICSYFRHIDIENTLFITECDTLAIAAIRAFRELGYKVPKEISIIGCGNTSFCKLSDPLLTSYAFPTKYMAKASIDLLKERIDAPSLPIRKLYITGELTVRSSVPSLIT